MSNSSNITKDLIFSESTIETIDMAITSWVKEKINVFTETQKGWNKVPVVWVSAERSYQTKESRDRRDISGTLILPIITIERISMEKDLSRKGPIFGNVPPVNDEKGGGGSLVISRRIKQDKTNNFARADIYKMTKRRQINFAKKNKKVVYETMTIPMPSYVTVTYNIKLKTQYQQQMNEMLQPFIVKTGGINYFVCKWEDHKYESFMQQDFEYNNNISSMGTEERKYETNIKVKILGYLIGGGKNEKQPKIVIRENAVDIKIPRERIVVGDKIQHSEKQKYYYGSEKIIGD